MRVPQPLESPMKRATVLLQLALVILQLIQIVMDLIR
jgi:hypothetical protein